MEVLHTKIAMAATMAGKNSRIVTDNRTADAANVGWWGKKRILSLWVAAA